MEGVKKEKTGQGRRRANDSKKPQQKKNDPVYDSQRLGDLRGAKKGDGQGKEIG